jgi:hypothetical protein
MVNVIYGGDSIFNKCAQKLAWCEILNLEPAISTLLRYSEVSITFSREDQWTSFSESGKFPLVLDLVVVGFRLTRVHIDGGSGLNLLFASTLAKMGLDISDRLIPSKAPFYSIIPGNASTPIRTVTLSVTLRFITFEVASFESSYHAILGRPALAKFMVVPHYVYLLLKMPRKTRVLTLRGYLQKSFECEKEAITYASTNHLPDTSGEVIAAAKQLSTSGMEIPTKKANHSAPKPPDNVGVKAIQLVEGDSSNTAMIGTGLTSK